MAARYDFIELLDFFSDGMPWEELDVDNDQGRDYFYSSGDESEAHIRVEDDRIAVTIDDALAYEGRLSDPIIKACIKPGKRAKPIP